MRIHHIGYLVKNIHKAIKEFNNLGYLGEIVVRDENRGIDICFVDKDGYTVELVSPYRENSIVSGLIKRYMNAPYHICYEAENFNKEIETLSQAGYLLMGEPQEAPAIDNKKVVFLMNNNLGIIEVVEE